MSAALWKSVKNIPAALLSAPLPAGPLLQLLRGSHLLWRVSLARMVWRPLASAPLPELTPPAGAGEGDLEPEPAIDPARASSFQSLLCLELVGI